MPVGLIIFLILLGILLFLIEFLVLPGITVAGIGGILSLVSAVILAFIYHGPRVGVIILICTSAVVFLTIILMLKAGTWRKLMLNKSIDGKIDLVRKEEGKIKVGDKGSTVTRLNPMGRVMVNGESYEAKSRDKLIDQNTEIEIVKIETNKLIVKPLK